MFGGTMKNVSMIKRVTLASAVILAGGCTWVTPVDGVEAIALVKPQVVQNCEKLSTAVLQVKDKVGFINRSGTKVSKELLTMARNQAVQAGADTIVAETTVDDGNQKYGLYRCR